MTFSVFPEPCGSLARSFMEFDRGVVADVVPKATVEERRCGADSERLQRAISPTFLSHCFRSLAILPLHRTVIFALGSKVHTAGTNRTAYSAAHLSARVLLPSAELGTRRCADVGRPACSSAAVLLTCKRSLRSPSDVMESVQQCWVRTRGRVPGCGERGGSRGRLGLSGV
jgi:hypothetical protein